MKRSSKCQSMTNILFVTIKTTKTNTQTSNITSIFEIKSGGMSGGSNDGVETLIEFDM